MQSRKGLKKAGSLLEEYDDFFKIKGLKLNPVKLIKNISVPTFVLETGLKLIENVLKECKDKNLGFISLDEDFEEEFENNPCQVRSNKLSTGFAKIEWLWKVC